MAIGQGHRSESRDRAAMGSIRKKAVTDDGPLPIHFSPAGSGVCYDGGIKEIIMCQGICFEVGKHGDEIKVWAGDPNEVGNDRDSHSAIRKFNKIPEVTSESWRRTPIECWMNTGWERAEDYAIHFDDGKPNWWDDECQSALISALQSEIGRRQYWHNKHGVWPGYPKIVGDVSAPWKAIGGYLDVSGTAKFDAPVLTSIGGYLAVSGPAKFDAPVLTSIGGNLDVSDTAKFDAPKLKKVNGKPYKKA
jgi:hypothetical protein